MKKYCCPICSAVIGYAELPAEAWFEVQCGAGDGGHCRAFSHYGTPAAEMYFAEVRCPRCNHMRLWGSFPPGSNLEDMKCPSCGKFFRFKAHPDVSRSPIAKRDRGRVRLQNLGPAPQLRGSRVRETG